MTGARFRRPFGTDVTKLLAPALKRRATVGLSLRDNN